MSADPLNEVVTLPPAPKVVSRPPGAALDVAEAMSVANSATAMLTELFLGVLVVARIPAVRAGRRRRRGPARISNSCAGPVPLPQFRAKPCASARPRPRARRRGFGAIFVTAPTERPKCHSLWHGCVRAVVPGARAAHQPQQHGRR